MNVRELARTIGISHMTVSRALNGSPNVAPDTRKKVLQAANEHGYSIHAPARELASGMTRTIGILYPYRTLRRVESWYTAQLMHDVRITLEQGGFDAIVAGYDTASRGSEDIARLCSQRKVDAVVVLGYEVTREALDALARGGHRYLCVNPPNEPWIAQHPALMVDSILGGELAAQTLRDSGCRHVCVLCEASLQFHHRFEGFVRRWGGSVPCYTLSDGTYDVAYRTACARIDTLRGCDGIFVGSDVSAIGVVNALQDAGVAVPESVAVCGYDDIDAAVYCRPALTTVHQPRGRISQGVFTWLTTLRESLVGVRRGRASGEPAGVESSPPEPQQATVFAPRVVVRATTRIVVEPHGGAS